MGWATSWAVLKKTPLVTLLAIGVETRDTSIDALRVRDFT
jgi:hypothetical protein